MALLEILEPMADGASNVEIAQSTGLKVSTIAGRRARTLDFFQANTTYQVRLRAKEMGLIGECGFGHATADGFRSDQSCMPAISKPVYPALQH